MNKIVCSVCGAEYGIGDFPICGGDPSQHARPSGGFWRGRATKFDPVVVFRGKDGRLSYPGSSHETPPPGFERVEINSTAGVRRLQKQMDDQARREHDRHQELEERQFGALRAEKRASLRAKMRHMSPQGKDFARLAMKKTDEKPRKRYNPGSFVEPFEFDRSNRAAHNSEATGWKDRA